MATTPIWFYSRDNPSKIFRRVQDKDRRNTPRCFDPSKRHLNCNVSGFVGELKDTFKCDIKLPCLGPDDQTNVNSWHITIGTPSEKSGIRWEKFILRFRALGAFLVFTKMLTFCDKVMWEWGNPPSATPVFAISPQKKTYLRVQIDQISLSHFCKTCFSTSGWFWHAKKHDEQT